jgi:hypothetical protein
MAKTVRHTIKKGDSQTILLVYFYFFQRHPTYIMLTGIYYKIATLKGQSHEKVGEMSVWGISLGPN